jgi:probable addiction module antidote protein
MPGLVEWPRSIEMMRETTPFDAAEYLQSADAIAAFLEDAFEIVDVGFTAHALGVVARALGMTSGMLQKLGI